MLAEAMQPPAEAVQPQTEAMHPPESCDWSWNQSWQSVIGHATSHGNLWLVVQPVVATGCGNLQLVVQSVVAICDWSCNYLWLQKYETEWLLAF